MICSRSRLARLVVERDLVADEARIPRFAARIARPCALHGRHCNIVRRPVQPTQPVRDVTMEKTRVKRGGDEHPRGPGGCRLPRRTWSSGPGPHRGAWRTTWSRRSRSRFALATRRSASRCARRARPRTGAGFLFTEGLLDGPDDLLSIDHALSPSGRREPNVVTATTPEAVEPRLGGSIGGFVAASGCGVRGRRSIEAVRRRGLRPRPTAC